MINVVQVVRDPLAHREFNLLSRQGALHRGSASGMG